MIMSITLFLCLTLFQIESFAFSSSEENNIKALSNFLHDDKRRILRVPLEFPTIKEAIESAKDGDWVIIASGVYLEKNIDVTKRIVISSEWKIKGDEDVIKKTIIDSGKEKLFSIWRNGVEISGLTIKNGEHPLDIHATVKITNNYCFKNMDAISLETGSGGYVAFNVIENDIDDGIDIDIGENEHSIGSNIIVEYNKIINSRDDGIEIRLFSYAGQNIDYTINNNIIIGSGGAGIQIISYDNFTGKVFHIHHNVFQNCKTGLGCMEGGKTVEDHSGASLMDEYVYLYNNTILDNEVGVTGGNRIIAINNIILNNTLGGFKGFGQNSVIINNLFFNNNASDLIAIAKNATVKKNIYSKDPLINVDNYSLRATSPCVDSGIKKYMKNGKYLMNLSKETYRGMMPDIGAIEYNKDKSFQQIAYIDAGKDTFLINPVAAVKLEGIVKNRTGKYLWEQLSGPKSVTFQTPDKLVTNINFPQAGIYEISLSCFDGVETISDELIVRCTNMVNNDHHFIKGSEDKIIEAEEVNFGYGEIYVHESNGNPKNKFLEICANRTGNPFLEYFIATGQLVEYDLWLFLKAETSGESTLNIDFNNKSIGEVHVTNCDSFYWVKAQKKLNISPGQWSLLIQSLSGKILLDKMILSPDPKFSPDKKNNPTKGFL